MYCVCSCVRACVTLLCSPFKLKLTQASFSPIALVLPAACSLRSMASSMKIFIKKVGEEPQELTVNLCDTVLQVKERLQLNSVSLRLRQTPLKNSTTMEQAGVQEGAVLTAFATNKAPQGFDNRNQYQAARSLKLGKTHKSVAHASLRQATQAVVTQESALLGQKWRTSAKR